MIPLLSGPSENKLHIACRFLHFLFSKHEVSCSIISVRNLTFLERLIDLTTSILQFLLTSPNLTNRNHRHEIFSNLFILLLAYDEDKSI
jgi:hypothetical protein